MEEVEQPIVEKQPENEKAKDDDDDVDEEDLVCYQNDFIWMNEKLLWYISQLAKILLYESRYVLVISAGTLIFNSL